MPRPDKPIQSARGLVPSIQTYSAIYSEYSIAFVVNDGLGDNLSRVIERGLRLQRISRERRRKFTYVMTSAKIVRVYVTLVCWEYYED